MSFEMKEAEMFTRLCRLCNRNSDLSDMYWSSDDQGSILVVELWTDGSRFSQPASARHSRPFRLRNDAEFMRLVFHLRRFYGDDIDEDELLLELEEFCNPDIDLEAA